VVPVLIVGAGSVIFGFFRFFVLVAGFFCFLFTGGDFVGRACTGI